VIFAGAYGSGKTEVAVNYAIRLALDTEDAVSIIDLDIVNPYFRSREAALEMESYGIRPINPLGEQSHADLPIIVPQIRAALESSIGRVVIDVGGDDLGARVLSSMTDAFESADYEFLMVLNAKRPFTANVDGALRMMRLIESSSRLKFTGIVSNSHLIGETTPETVLEGIALSHAAGERADIPVVFACAMDEVVAIMDRDALSVPLMSLSRRMLKPWEHRTAAANEH
jgi:hypothetical protein